MTGCYQAVTPPVPGRFIRLYENTRMKSEKEMERGRSKRRWRESREEVVKDSREKEFLETYISSLKDRGETLTSDQSGASLET